jgi:hypothetical protein
MAIFGGWFGGKSQAGSSQPGVLAQVPEVEEILRKRVGAFQDRTKLHSVLVFPIIHRVAAKLFVEDFGAEVALRHYQGLVASLTSDGMIREDQFKNFGWPDVPLHEVTHVHELDALLWGLMRELTGQGYLKEAIASAFVNVALKAASKMDGLVAAGFLMTVLKELRAGVYTPPPDVRPEPPADADEASRIIFIQSRDWAYMFKDRSGLEWQHLLPGIQRVCAIFAIRYRGRDGALALFRDQINRLARILDQSPKNPPQNLPLTPLHITNIANFNEAFQKLAESVVESSGIHPVWVAEALSRLTIELASKYYDMIYLSSILSSCCTDIERGQYDFVRKTH